MPEAPLKLSPILLLPLSSPLIPILPLPCHRPHLPSSLFFRECETTQVGGGPSHARHDGKPVSSQ